MGGDVVGSRTSQQQRRDRGEAARRLRYAELYMRAAHEHLMHAEHDYRSGAGSLEVVIVAAHMVTAAMLVCSELEAA
jgi:hypothetical protein